MSFQSPFTNAVCRSTLLVIVGLTLAAQCQMAAAGTLIPVRVAALVVTQEAQTQPLHIFQVRHKRVAEVRDILVPLIPNNRSVKLLIDEETNELMVSGDDGVKQIVASFLRAVDLPADQLGNDSFDQPVVAQPPQDELRLYRVPAELRQSLIATIESRTAGQGVRLQAAPDVEVFFATATADAHREIESLVDEALQWWRAGVQRQSANRNTQMALPIRPREVSRFFPVRRESIERTQRQVVAMFENRLLVDPNQSGFGFRIDLGEERSLSFVFDSNRQGVMVNGDDAAVAQFGQLVLALADDDAAFGQRTQVIRLRREAHTQLQEVVPAADGNEPRQSALPSTRNSIANFDPAVVNSPPARLASSIQDAPIQGDGLSLPENNRQQPDDTQAATRPRIIQQFEGVEVNSLPDLDVIILRGRDQELEQLAEIIRQLEVISQDTQAEIQIVPLRFVNSERMVQIIGETNQALIGARQGRVSFTPLVKPNAVLLIGWGDAVAATMELISELDVAVAPETQFAVFGLRHATAADVQQTLQSFFTGRGGLGPEIRSTVDARTNSIIVYAAPRDLAEARAVIDQLDSDDTQRIQQARVFEIRHSLAQDIAATLQQAISGTIGNGQGTALELMIPDEQGRQLLRSGVLENVSITVNPRNNTLIVSAPANSFDLLGGMIEVLDTPGFSVKIKIFPVLNSDAASMVQTLRSLLPSQQSANLQPQLSSAPEETSLAPLRFTVDVRSNSIIASGSEGDLRIVEALIIRLDEQGSMQRRSMVYQLKNSPAIDVALAVNEFLRNKRIVESAQPGEANPFQRIEEEVIVVPEPVSNKLILSATTRYFDEIQNLIEKLDEQPPEVMIQVLIAEVSLNDTDEFGIEMGIQDSVLFDRSLLSELLTTTNSTQETTAAGVTTITEEIIRAATNTPGFDFNSGSPLGNSGSELALAGANTVGSQGISNFGLSRQSDELGYGGLVLSASSQNVSVLIRALQESRRLEILSRPQIRTLDNQPAFIQVGQRVPRIVGSTVNQNGQSNNVDLENVGLILGVTPRISPDGNVVMEIDAEKSNVGPEQEGVPVSVSLDGTIIRSPRVDTTTAQASVSAASGETIILGGLITKSTQDIHRKVPVLGDIPILNSLFRYDSVVERRTELLIILTPQVIRSREDSERIKQTEIARMSWCAADVYNIHGDIGYVFPEDSLLNDSWNTEVIYPDADPRGTSSRRSEPPQSFQREFLDGPNGWQMESVPESPAARFPNMP